MTVAFPFNWCSNSLMFGMGTELMFPLPPSFVVGYMTLMNSLFLDFVYLGFYFQPVFGTYNNYHRSNASGFRPAHVVPLRTRVHVLHTGQLYGRLFVISFYSKRELKAITTSPFSTRSIRRLISQWRMTRVQWRAREGVRMPGVRTPQNVFL